MCYRQAYSDAFKAADVDNDNKLSKEECISALSGMGASNEDIEKAFGKQDLNQDGFVSYDEFMKMV